MNEDEYTGEYESADEIDAICREFGIGDADEAELIDIPAEQYEL